MCDDAPEGLCAMGAFLLGCLAGGTGGFVAGLLGHEALGVFGGVALGVLAAAYPDGPPKTAFLAVMSAAAPVSFASCAALRTEDPGVLFACAVATSGAASLALFASGALAASRRARLAVEEALLKETSV